MVKSLTTEYKIQDSFSKTHYRLKLKKQPKFGDIINNLYVVYSGFGDILHDGEYTHQEWIVVLDSKIPQKKITNIQKIKRFLGII